MPFCPRCGAEIERSFNFCSTCGSALPAGDQAPAVPEVAGATPMTLAYRLSPRRILVMTVLSFGLYLFYWFYLTWQQYRDHTKREAYPVWHAMSLSVPVYDLFRTHAHMNSFKELMHAANLNTTINPGWAVVVVLISSVLGLVSFFLTGGAETKEVTFRAALVAFGLNLASLVMVTKLLLQVQENLNQYWESLQNITLGDAGIGGGEVLLVIIGALSWLTTLVLLVSP